MSISTAIVKIQGNKPLLWNHFGPEVIPLTTREKTGEAGNDPSEWRRTVLKTPKGQLYLEPSYIFGTIRDGAKHTTRKRGTLQPFVAATLQISDERILVDRFIPPKIESLEQAKDQPVYLDVQSVKNPATGARKVRYRVAASSGWKAEFTISWDNTMVSEHEMETAVGDAGRFAGLGDGRRIGYGRFEVLEFKVNGNGKELKVSGKTNAKKPAASGNLARNARKSVAAGRS